MDNCVDWDCQLDIVTSVGSTYICLLPAVVSLQQARYQQLRPKLKMLYAVHWCMLCTGVYSGLSVGCCLDDCTLWCGLWIGAPDFILDIYGINMHICHSQGPYVRAHMASFCMASTVAHAFVSHAAAACAVAVAAGPLAEDLCAAVQEL